MTFCFREVKIHNSQSSKQASRPLLIDLTQGPKLEETAQAVWQNSEKQTT